MKRKAIERQIPGDTWRDLICDDYEGDEWVKREDNFQETWRWGNWYEVILEHIPTCTFWSSSYKTGGDSDGLNDVNDFSGPETLTQVGREPKTVWEWRPIYEGPD